MTSQAVLFEGTKEAKEQTVEILKDCLQNVAPFVGVIAGALSFPAPDNHLSSVVISLSLDFRDTWKNSIFENSRYMKFMLDQDGTLKQISGRYKFRKRKVKDLQHLKDTLTKFVKENSETIV